jgi:hypothetical protein
MLSYERRHGPFRTWFHKRPDGGVGGTTPIEGCCILLESDPGDGSQVILLESDTDGTSCIEPEDCGGPPGTSFFVFLSDPADDFEFLTAPGDDFLFLE